MNYPHLAARIFNTPLLIAPGKLDAIVAGLGSRLLGADVATAPGLLAEAQDPLPVEAWSSRRGEFRFDKSARTGYGLVDGVAVVTARGVLAHRTRLGANTEMVIGYEQVARDLQAAAADPDAHAILLDLDSPGGEVSGAFELAAAVREIAGTKPVHALADAMAASAAYLIASGATSITIAPTGYAGSIGVVMTHVDMSRALANDGLAVTHIYAGAHKVDGTPYAPLPAEVRARFQDEIDAIYAEFVRVVADHRGRTPEAIRATQAAIFRGPAAVEAGLVDRVETADQLIQRLAGARIGRTLLGQPARHTLTTGAHPMSETPDAGVLLTSEPSYTQADLELATQTARLAGADAERTRILAILDHPEAAERQSSALALARKPAMDVETAGEVLATLPKASAAAAPVNALALQMAAMGNPPTVGGDAPADPADDPAALARGWDQAFGIK